MIRLLLAAVLLLGIGGCDESPTGTAAVAPSVPSPAAEVPRIALVMKTLTNPFFVEMERGARRAEQEFGVQLIVKTAAQETSIEQQIAIVEDLTRQRVNAIVVAPGDSIRLIPSLRAAQEQGIAVVNIDNRLDQRFAERTGLHGVPFISVDNEHGAYLAARYLAGLATGPGKAAIIEGIRSAANAEARKRGALRAFKEAALVTGIVLETANWKIDEAYAVAGHLLAETPDLRLIFAANDMMAFGVIRRLREMGRTEVKVAAFDALQEARAAIAAGELEATVDQQAAEQGYLGVRYAVDLLKGTVPPAETTVAVRLVTRESL